MDSYNPSSSLANTEVSVLKVDVVRSAIAKLKAQRIHEIFPAYLYLRRSSKIEGSLTGLEPDWKKMAQKLSVPGGPANKDYYRPFASRQGKNQNKYWLNNNLAGSYAPSSLRRMGSFLLDSTGQEYELDPDHLDQALELCLYGQRVPAWAISCFYERNTGFHIKSKNNIKPAIEVFRAEMKFEDDKEFETLFDPTEVPPIAGALFEVADIHTKSADN